MSMEFASIPVFWGYGESRSLPDADRLGNLGEAG